MKGNEQVSVFELLQKSNKKSLQYCLNLTLLENILNIHIRPVVAGAAYVSHASGTGAHAPCLMQGLFSHTADTGTDNPSCDNDNDNDDEELYVEEEPAAANVPPVAAGQGQEQVQYATNRLAAVGRDLLLKNV